MNWRQNHRPAATQEVDKVTKKLKADADPPDVGPFSTEAKVWGPKRPPKHEDLGFWLQGPI